MTWGLETAARTLWQEARGEPLEGQQAVAWTFRNRLQDGRWGKSLASVCLWKGQFSGWYMPHDPNFALACGLLDDDATLAKMRAVVTDVMTAPAVQDPTHGATHYLNDAVANPAWDDKATFCCKIGRHKFYKGVA